MDFFQLKATMSKDATNILVLIFKCKSVRTSVTMYLWNCWILSMFMFNFSR